MQSLAGEAAALPARLQQAAEAANLADRKHAAASQALQVPLASIQDFNLVCRV